MSDESTEHHLDQVYSSGSVDELTEGYDQWARTYDQDMGSGGYRHPSICLALLARHVDPRAGWILDAGAGTGLIGEWMRIVGYEHLVALDASEGMLEVARSKRVYAELHQGLLGELLPFADDRFAAVVCSGVFTLGHVGAEGLDDLLRVVRPGGSIVLTVKDKLYSEGGFRAHVEALCKANRCRQVEDTGSYVSIPGEESQSTSRALVLEAL